MREETLPAEMYDHDLIGNYKGHRECHLASDWLLIYRVDDGKLTLTATRLGSHSDLFRYLLTEGKGPRFLSGNSYEHVAALGYVSGT